MEEGGEAISFGGEVDQVEAKKRKLELDGPQEVKDYGTVATNGPLRAKGA